MKNSKKIDCTDNYIKRLRIQNNIPIEFITDELGVTNQEYIKWEESKECNVPINYVVKLANLYNIEPVELASNLMSSIELRPNNKEYIVSTEQELNEFRNYINDLKDKKILNKAEYDLVEYCLNIISKYDKNNKEHGFDTAEIKMLNPKVLNNIIMYHSESTMNNAKFGMINGILTSDKFNLTAISSLLKRYRLKMGYTFEMIAEKVGVTPEIVYLYECGNLTFMYRIFVNALFKFYKIPDKYIDKPNTHEFMEYTEESLRFLGMYNTSDKVIKKIMNKLLR